MGSRAKSLEMRLLPSEVAGRGGPEPTLRATDECWAFLYQTYRPLVYARCRRLLPTEVAADDATQEIFTKLIAKVVEVPAGDVTARWLRRVATNHCLNQLRGERRRRLDSSEPMETASSTDHFQHRDLVHGLLSGMPDKLREVAWLRYVVELELHVIAHRLGVSRRTVVDRLGAFQRRARRAVAKLTVATTVGRS
jgi:RNA polymerase sigma-70 factor (ECF subfamily)